MKRILITEPFAQEAVELLQKEGFEVVVRIDPPEEELAEIISDFDGLIVRSKTRVNSRIITAGKRLRIIGRAGVGMDNVDVETATRQGIIAMNAPDANTISTAELTMLFIIALSRNFYQAVSSTKNGKWEKSKLRGSELYKKTLGIIGLGRIGSEVAKRAISFGMEVIAYDPFVSPDRERQLNIRLLDLDQILGKSDYITLHLSLTKESYHMIGKEAFGKMKDGVRIINCARGGLIDEEALYEAVSDGKVAGCGLDVFEKEPPGNTPLLSLDGVIASPHLGASTAEAQKNVSLQMARQFKNALQDGIIDNSVNCPHVDSAVLARIGPYLDMSEKLGSFLCQVTGENIESAEITCTVDIAEYHARLFTLSFLKGLLSCTVPEYVNYVNSLVVARERGIRVTEKKSSHPDDFPGIIKAEITTAGSSRSISGTIFGKDDPRIVSIDGYRVDVSPKGCLLFCINSDKPGAVAHISSVLTGAGINIAGMTVGRKEAGGEALTVLNIDSRTSQEVLARIKENPVIRKAYLVEL